MKPFVKVRMHEARRWRLWGVIAAVMLNLVAAPMMVRADSETALMQRVDGALRGNSNLNGAQCYTAAPGVIVLYGKVFNDQDRALAEQTAHGVRGVRQVVNTLRTSTGQWLEVEDRINDTLQLNGFQGVSARVIGSEVYLSGQVNSSGEEQRAIRTVSSISPQFKVVNFMRVGPQPLF